MILACHNCSARFLVADSAIGAGGRAVRCGRCGHVWFAAPPPEIAGPAAESEDDRPPPPDEATASSAGGSEEDDSAALRRSPDDPPSDAPPRRVQLPVLRRERSRWRARIAWIVVAAMAIGLAAAAAWWYRAEIVTHWPDAERLYAAIGVDALPLGAGLRLTIEETVNTVSNGTRVLSITGRIANTNSRSRRVPGLRGMLFNENERELQHWTIPVPVTNLAPGQAAEFRTRLTNPSRDAVRISIVFHEPG